MSWRHRSDRRRPSTAHLPAGLDEATMEQIKHIASTYDSDYVTNPDPSIR